MESVLTPPEPAQDPQDGSTSYTPPDNPDLWPEHSTDYLRWCLERSFEMEQALKDDAASLQKRAMIFVAAQWALVGAQPGDLVACPYPVLQVLLVAFLLASGFLLLMVLRPWPTENYNLDNLFSPANHKHPIPATLCVALDQHKKIVAMRNEETRRRGARTLWCQGLAAAGVLIALAVLCCTYVSRAESAKQPTASREAGGTLIPEASPAGPSVPSETEPSSRYAVHGGG